LEFTVNGNLKVNKSDYRAFSTSSWI